jgi:hypothetical protein
MSRVQRRWLGPLAIFITHEGAIGELERRCFSMHGLHPSSDDGEKTEAKPIGSQPLSACVSLARFMNPPALCRNSLAPLAPALPSGRPGRWIDPIEADLHGPDPPASERSHFESSATPHSSDDGSVLAVSSETGPGKTLGLRRRRVIGQTFDIEDYRAFIGIGRGAEAPRAAVSRAWKGNACACFAVGRGEKVCKNQVHEVEASKLGGARSPHDPGRLGPIPVLRPLRLWWR